MNGFHHLVALVNAFSVWMIIVIWTWPNTDSPSWLTREFILIPPLAIVVLGLFDVSTLVRVRGYVLVGATMLVMVVPGLGPGWGILYGLSLFAIFLGLVVEREFAKPKAQRRAERRARKYSPPRDW